MNQCTFSPLHVLPDGRLAFDHVAGLMQSANLPRRHFNNTATRISEAWKCAYRDTLRRVLDGDRLVVLSGPTGTGKTQAATDALQHVLRDGWSARLDYAVDIGCTLRQAVATGSHWHECPEVQRDLLRPSVLAIEGQPIEFPGETRNAPALDELIRCRRDRGHTTLLVVDDNDDGRTDDYLRSVLAMQPDCWIEFTERVAGKGAAHA